MGGGSDTRAADLLELRDVMRVQNVLAQNRRAKASGVLVLEAAMGNLRSLGAILHSLLQTHELPEQVVPEVVRSDWVGAWKLGGGWQGGRAVGGEASLLKMRHQNSLKHHLSPCLRLVARLAQVQVVIIPLQRRQRPIRVLVVVVAQARDVRTGHNFLLAVSGCWGRKRC